MYKLLSFVLILLLVIVWSCGSGSDEQQKEQEKTETVQKRVINTQQEFDQALQELGITVYPGAEFSTLKAEAPVNAMDQDQKTIFTAVYTLSGDDYSQNYNQVMDYYKKIYEEKLKAAGWRDTSINGTGIYNFHPKEGDFSNVSISVQDTDMIKEGQPQELQITLFVR